MCGVLQEQKDWQWKQAMDYLSAVSELNYMTQIVIMLYEDNDKVSRALGGRLRRRPSLSSCLRVRVLQEPTSEERFHVELHFSPGVKGCEDEENAPLGSGFRPASSEVRHSFSQQRLVLMNAPSSCEKNQPVSIRHVAISQSNGTIILSTVRYVF